jgi:hypothetical protein
MLATRMIPNKNGVVNKAEKINENCEVKGRQCFHKGCLVGGSLFSLFFINILL